MVKYWGMSDKFGLRTLGEKKDPGEVESVNNEIKRILQESYERAKKTLEEHRNELQALAQALMKYETLDADAIRVVIAKALSPNGHKKELEVNSRGTVSSGRNVAEAESSSPGEKTQQ